MLALAIGLAELFHLSGPTAAGVFSGGLTNTPALASTVATLTSKGLNATTPVVSYSLCYPVGVIGVLLAVYLYRRLTYKRPGDDELVTHTVEVTADLDRTLAQIATDEHLDVRFVRTSHEGKLTLINDENIPAIGDQISAIGPQADVERMASIVGHHVDNVQLEDARNELDRRRIFVSRADLAGKRISELNLRETFGATITRVRRGDQDMLVHDDFVLLLGDRVRVVAPPSSMKKLTRLFGDSYRHLSEIDMASFGIGLALGLLLGLVPIPLPGTVLHLGNAGGPLVVGLILGGLRRTGPFTWDPPYSANLTLRQFGLVLFLAGIGTKAGPGFFTAITKGTTVLPIVGAGLVLTLVMTLTFLLAGHKLLKVHPDELTGMLAGTQTQPAVLAYAVELSDDERPNVGYSSVYPMAMVFKIIAVQIILLFLGLH
jgi:putative transport protein